MKYIANQRVSRNSLTGIYSYSPWYLAKDIWGGRVVSNLVIERVGIPSYLGVAYMDWARDAVVVYPKPLHIVVRLMGGCYWRFLRSFYWIGLIDTHRRERFRWNDFFRIKVR